MAACPASHAPGGCHGRVRRGPDRAAVQARSRRGDPRLPRPLGAGRWDFLGIPRIVSDPLLPDSSAASPTSDAYVPPLLAGAEWFPGGLEGAFAQLETSRTAIARTWGINIGDWRSAMHSAGDLTVNYTTPEILGDIELRSGWHCVGPLMDAGPERRQEPARPRVYVALGTFYNYAPDAFRAAIDALQTEPVDVIVSTGRGYISPADLEPLPPNVTVHDFVDSRQVLAEAQVHITHGGCSSVHESLLAGVPMVCIPQGSDQFMWSERVAQLGAGTIAQTTPESIQAAVRRLLDDEGPRRRTRELGLRLQRYDGERRVAALLGRLTRQEVGGRGVRSASARGRSSRPSATARHQGGPSRTWSRSGAAQAPVP